MPGLGPWIAPFAAPALVGVVVVAAWQAACRHWQVPVYLLPAPSDIAACLRDNWPDLLRALGSTLLVTAAAFVSATVIGVLIAFLFVQSRVIEFSFLPYAILLQVTPIVAVAPLIIILVERAMHDSPAATPVALTVCATVIALFPIISNTTLGLRSVDRGLLDYFRMNKVGRLQTLWRLRVPSALPYFMAGLRISSGLALIGAVVAEFVAGTGGRGAGLAYEILQAGNQLDIARMFAALLLIAAAGVALFALMAALQFFLLRHWHDSALKDEGP